MIDLLNLQPSEAERIAYTEGFTMAAELFKRMDELESRLLSYECALEAIRDAGRDGTMTARQCAGAASEVLP